MRKIETAVGKRPFKLYKEKTIKMSRLPFSLLKSIPVGWSLIYVSDIELV